MDKLTAFQLIIAHAVSQFVGVTSSELCSHLVGAPGNMDIESELTLMRCLHQLDSQVDDSGKERWYLKNA